MSEVTKEPSTQQPYYEVFNFSDGDFFVALEAKNTPVSEQVMTQIMEVLFSPMKERLSAKNVLASEGGMRQVISIFTTARNVLKLAGYTARVISVMPE